MRGLTLPATFITASLAFAATRNSAWAQGAGVESDTSGVPAPVPVDTAAPGGTVKALLDWARDAYDRDPQLVSAIVVMVLGLTALALLALVYTGARRAVDAFGQRQRPRPAPVRPASTTPKRTVPALEVIDESTAALPVRGAMVRIGRHEENDICLPNKSVHRYHAVMHLTDELGYVITDLSGLDGNGVFVNAERVENAPLHNGDLIELGDVKLRFRLNELH